MKRAALALIATALFLACGRTLITATPDDAGTSNDSGPVSVGSGSGAVNGSSSGAGNSGGGPSSSSGGGSSSGGSSSGSSSGAPPPPKCPPTSGCCGATGTESGTSNTACGFGGQTCVDCTAIGLACVPPLSGGGGGVCGALDAGAAPDGAVQCGPATCAGCCAANVCLPGTVPGDCGSHGLACVQCTGAGVTCAGTSSGGMCVGSAGSDGGTSSGCGPTNCAGCCDSNGVCQDPVTVSACGTMGVSCQFCLPGQACNSGQCQTTPGCGPANCFGCCQSGTCLGGTDDTACGTGGGACQACPGNECFALGAKSGGFCYNGRACGSSVCAGGCCDGYGQCQGGHSSAYCDNGGDGGPYSICTVCAGDCSSGICVGTSCSLSNCAGCCMPDGTCWQGGLDDAHCGTGDPGHLCFNCGPGYICAPNSDGNDSICTVACSPENCQGCCVGGVCSTGTDPTSCGTGGSLCVQCGSGQSCLNGACLTLTQCGATLCAGCCDSTVCHTGTADSECGTGGATCQNCTTDGGTCAGGSCPP